MHISSSTLSAPTSNLFTGSSSCFQKPKQRFEFNKLIVACVLLLLHMLAAQAVLAQDVATYQLTASSGTFTPITGGTPIASLSQPDEISPIINLPFSFFYGGYVFNSLQATTHGYLCFRTEQYAQEINSLSGGNDFVAALWDEMSGAGGTASYVITGAAPNRVFTFEWLNWRWGAGATAANISFQAKLYEGTNLIQFIYRPEAGAFNSATASATIGLDGGTFSTGDLNQYSDFVSLNNASANPSLVSNAYPTGASVNTINTRPVAGQTYTFTPTNDYCAHATPLAYGSAVLGTTINASQYSDPRTACRIGTTHTPSNAAGVYYRLIGNGQTITVNTCYGPTATSNNTKLFVYSGGCGNFTCVGSSDDLLTGGCGTNSLASAVTFATQAGMPYHIYVQYANRGATGPFGLSVSGTGLASRAALGAGSLEVFPNPAARAFMLQLPSIAGERSAQLTLLNSLGQSVQTRTVALQPAGTQALVDIQALPVGIYTVRVQAGGQVATQQVIVQ
jgi:hypothetical protein